MNNIMVGDIVRLKTDPEVLGEVKSLKNHGSEAQVQGKKGVKFYKTKDLKLVFISFKQRR